MTAPPEQLALVACVDNDDGAVEVETIVSPERGLAHTAYACTDQLPVVPGGVSAAVTT
jgi:hypothetical protein